MSILDALTPRTVKVSGARIVRLGVNEVERTPYRFLNDEQKREYHRQRKLRQKMKKRGAA